MAVSGLETIRKLLGVGELLCFESEPLMCVRNGLHSHPVKRVSMGLTVNSQMALKLTVNCHKRNIFTVNRQMSEPKLAVKLLRYP